MLAVECDERELRQVELMDLKEELLPQAWISRRLLLLIERIQGRVAVEIKVASHALGRDLVARQYRGIVGVIAKVIRKLSNIISARHGPSRRRSLPPSQEGAGEGQGL